MGRKKISVALTLLSVYPLSALAQPVTSSQEQFNQAGSVSVDMNTGEPFQPPQTTAILAIYRGPGYFDESLLDISTSMSSSDFSNDSSGEPSPTPAGDEWGSFPVTSEQQEELPPPPVLPPLAPAAIEGQAPLQDPPVLPDVSVDPPPLPAQDIYPSQPGTEQGTMTGTSSSDPASESDGEPLPPPPMLETLPSFPQGE